MGEERKGSRVLVGLLAWLIFLAPQHAVKASEAENAGDEQEATSRISDEAVVKVDPNAVPKRPSPVLELGNHFLGSGKLWPGFEIPTGAVWQPSFLLFGTLRTAVQAFHDASNTTLSEWANRLDLFGNLQLTGTERVLVGMRPLDRNPVGTNDQFSGYRFAGGPDEFSFRQEFSAEVTTLFAEGDLGQIFPRLDPHDRYPLDIGFSVGRQPLLYQEGMLIDDDIVDAVGVTRNNFLPVGGSNLQVTGLYAWNEVNRGSNVESPNTDLYGLFTTGDYPLSTINADFVYSRDKKNGTDGAHWGISGIQRLWRINSTFRFLGSQALDGSTPAIASGYLLFTELSFTPPRTENFLYLDAFGGIDKFRSAARGLLAGGPLGRTGILFAAVGLPRYGAALGNNADNSAGAALGYQMFFQHFRRQIIFELGGRDQTRGEGNGAVAIGTRLQQAIGQHLIVQVDGFVTSADIADGPSRVELWGGRFEMRVEF